MSHFENEILTNYGQNVPPPHHKKGSNKSSFRSNDFFLRPLIEKLNFTVLTSDGLGPYRQRKPEQKNMNIRKSRLIFPNL